MKKLMNFLCFLMTLITVQVTQAQTVDEIINKHIDAIGGKEKMMALNSVKFEGSLNTQGFDVVLVVTVLNGKGARTDISVPGMSEGYRIVTPTKGWNFLPFQGMTGPEDAPDDQVQSGQSQLDIQSPLLNYAAKGHKVELLGNEKVDGADCYKLKITYKNGKVSTLFINTTSYYKVKSISKTNVGGQEMDLETTFTDFKKLPEGYVFPYSSTNQSGTIIYSSIEVNKPVDEKIFTAN
jgi:hypothetical protein